MSLITRRKDTEKKFPGLDTDEVNTIQDPVYQGTIEYLTVAVVPVNVPAWPRLGGAGIFIDWCIRTWYMYNLYTVLCMKEVEKSRHKL